MKAPMIHMFCLSALALALSSALAEERGHPSKDEAHLRVVIQTIDHSKQRYPAVGDWRFEKDGTLRVTVSKMSDRRFEALIALHETVEALLCEHAGVSPEAVDRFDKAYEAKRKRGDDSEPGDDPKAPYHREHVFATKL